MCMLEPSWNSSLKILGEPGGGMLKAAAVGGIRSNHSMVSQGVSLKARFTIPVTSGKVEALPPMGDRVLSVGSLLVYILS